MGSRYLRNKEPGPLVWGLTQNVGAWGRGRRVCTLEIIAGVEKVIAFVGALLVGVLALVALKADWKTTGLDNNFTKILLGLMAFGCVLVVLAATSVIGKG